MNIDIRDKYGKHLFVGDVLLRKCSIGLVLDRYIIGFGYYVSSENDSPVYGVYLFDEEYSTFHDFPFTDGHTIKLVKEIEL